MSSLDDVPYVCQDWRETDNALDDRFVGRPQSILEVDEHS